MEMRLATTPNEAKAVKATPSTQKLLPSIKAMSEALKL